MLTTTSTTGGFIASLVSLLRFLFVLHSMYRKEVNLKRYAEVIFFYVDRNLLLDA